MSDHTGDFKGFYQYSRAWYGKLNKLRIRDCVDDIMFGYYSPEGGTSGEMAMRWYKLENNKLPSAKLEVFEDTFETLNSFKDLIEELAKWENKNIQPDQFCELLKQFGFIDKTEEKSPYEIVVQ